MKHFYFALLHSLGLSQKRLDQILPEEVEDFFYSVNLAALLKIGIEQDKAQKILDKKTTLNVERVQRLLQEKNIRIVHKIDDEYPQLLTNIPDVPTFLYVRGKLPLYDSLISIVWSRKHSSYAQSCLEKIIPDMVRAGYTIVSGGAYGIDGLAHDITMKSGGQTLVVLGCGVDVVYPSSHRTLFDTVINGNGAIISQFPLWALAEPFNFPIRNTVVAGMSRWTLIAEAWEDSGTLITARLALEYNRDVFVIPADINREWARGSNALIRDGLGKLILSAEDILSEYQIVDKQLSLLSTLKPDFTDEIEEKLYDLLCLDSCTVDKLCDLTGYEISLIMNALGILEIEGIVVQHNGMYRIG